VAFRVKFKGGAPPPSDLYWRGPVMPIFDGRAWRVAQTQGVHTAPPYPPQGRPVDYEVTLEASGKFWLFALELPGELPPNSTLTSDYQLIAREAVRARVRYSQRSWPEAVTGADEKLNVLRESLALPRSGNPRVRAIAEAWREQYGKDGAAIVAAAESLFRDQLLTYTLNPPILGSDSIDEFLLDTKRGFCEHFATAFVFALRAAGVPARVVAGYQGGEINPIDGFLVVRQYDAHAWAEAWIAGRGWVRIDPTAISAPQRVANGAVASRPPGETPAFLLGANAAWLKELRNQLDAVTNGWNQWVLGYNPQRQRDLLLTLGINDTDWRNMSALISAAIGIVMLGLAAWVLRFRVQSDPALLAWKRFTARLVKHGLRWQPWEGPLAFASRAARQLPAHAAAISEIAQHYADLRYAPDPHENGLQQLKEKIGAFRP
jgi:transglutaminase-like putative cysteine protease